MKWSFLLPFFACLIASSFVRAADPPSLSSPSPTSSSTSISASASGSTSANSTASATGNATTTLATSLSLSLSTSLLTSQVVTVSSGRTLTLNTTIASVATQTVATTRNLTQITQTPTQLLSITAFAPGQSVSGVNLGPGDGYVAGADNLKIAAGSVVVAAIVGAFALY